MYKALLDDLHIVAVKYLSSNMVSDTAAVSEDFAKEIAIMRGSKNNNLVQSWGACCNSVST